MFRKRRVINFALKLQKRHSHQKGVKVEIHSTGKEKKLAEVFFYQINPVLNETGRTGR